MVQVDVFWAYSWGASLAAAAGPRLVQHERPFEAGYYSKTLLFLSLCWAPTGMLLLLRHPSWETMQVASSLQSMSEWLILSFGLTNITQGILGFWVGLQLLRRNEGYLAQLNWLAGYFGMFFILLYGWDGLGYDRFLYDRDMLAGSPAWSPGVATSSGALPALWRFLGSSVAGTLYIDGAYLLPPFFYLTARWTRMATKGVAPSAMRLTLRYLGAVFLVGLGAAALCALSVRGVALLLGITDQVRRGRGELPPMSLAHVSSYLIGLPLCLALLWRFALHKGGLVQRYLAPLDPGYQNRPQMQAELC